MFATIYVVIGLSLTAIAVVCGAVACCIWLDIVPDNDLADVEMIDMENLSKEYNRKFTIAHYGVMGIAIICAVCGFAGLSPNLAKAVETTGLTEEGVKCIGSYTFGMTMMLAGFIIAMINMIHNNSGRNELGAAITKVEELEEKVVNLNKEIAELKSGRTEDYGNGR